MLLITDLDGRLGESDQQIGTALRQLREVVEGQLCIITGRSLRALARIEWALQPGMLVAPWGGGNLLTYVGRDYYRLNPLRELPAALARARNQIAVPRSQSLNATNEIHLSDIEEAPGAAVVAAYWQFPLPERSAAVRVAESYALPVSTGRDCHWVNATVIPLPRLGTLQEAREVTGEQPVYYLGDSPADAECVSHVDRFFAPDGSPLAQLSAVTRYGSVAALSQMLQE